MFGQPSSSQSLTGGHAYVPGTTILYITAIAASAKVVGMDMLGMVLGCFADIMGGGLGSGRRRKGRAEFESG
jgi:hypothetical protein